MNNEKRIHQENHSKVPENNYELESEAETEYDKGLAEPDVFTKIKNVPSFIEVQRNLYSQKVMDKKMKRYEALKYSDEFIDGDFPVIIMVSEAKYKINSDDINVVQVSSINEFMNSINMRKKEDVKPREVSVKIG